jgi:hypothetical protein
MAKTTVKKTKGTTEPIMVNQIIIRPVDRSTKDIESWRSAHRYAEQSISAHRTRLYDLYSDIELDGHLAGITQKRIDAVLNKKLRFEVNGKKVDEMDHVIRSTAFRKVVRLLIEKKFWGISGMEFIPGEKLQVVEIPRKHIKPQLKVISKEQNGEEGFPYEQLQHVWITGDPNDLGLYLKCAPYAIYKRGDLADWAQYVEIFGQPVRVIKYDAYDLKTKMELQTVLDESGGALALMIPKQADFELKDGKQSNGTGELQERLMIACNNEMSVIILGNTETTSSSKSSGYAQAQEHGKQQVQVTLSDLEDVLNELNSDQFLSILQSYNFPASGGNFLFEKEIDLEALNVKKDIDLAIAGKVPVADDYWYEKYDIPKPDNYDELRRKMDERATAAGVDPEEDDEDPALPKPPGKKGATKKKEPKQQATLSGWEKLRADFIDFFDRAPKD